MIVAVTSPKVIVAKPPDPVDPVDGTIIYNIVERELYYKVGTTWRRVDRDIKERSISNIISTTTWQKMLDALRIDEVREDICKLHRRIEALLTTDLGALTAELAAIKIKVGELGCRVASVDGDMRSSIDVASKTQVDVERLGGDVDRMASDISLTKSGIATKFEDLEGEQSKNNMMVVDLSNILTSRVDGLATAVKVIENKIVSSSSLLSYIEDPITDQLTVCLSPDALDADRANIVLPLPYQSTEYGGVGTESKLMFCTDGSIRAGTITGSQWDRVVRGATSVAFGSDNQAFGAQSFVGGGYKNSAFGYQTVIGGGQFNHTSKPNSVVCGGRLNNAEGISSFIGGGYGNKTHGEFATIAGGEANMAHGDGSVVGGGDRNVVLSHRGAILGGSENQIDERGDSSSIVGGVKNHLYGRFSTISGGRDNTITEDAVEGVVIAGGQNNLVKSRFSVVSGGRDNKVSGVFSVVSGGRGNVVMGGSESSTICGGRSNVVGPKAAANLSAICGGKKNTVDDCFTSGVFVGEANVISGTTGIAKGCAIIGGYANIIAAVDGDCSDSVVVGGKCLSNIGDQCNTVYTPRLNVNGGQQLKVSRATKGRGLTLDDHILSVDTSEEECIFILPIAPTVSSSHGTGQHYILKHRRGTYRMGVSTDRTDAKICDNDGVVVSTISTSKPGGVIEIVWEADEKIWLQVR